MLKKMMALLSKYPSLYLELICMPQVKASVTPITTFAREGEECGTASPAQDVAGFQLVTVKVLCNFDEKSNPLSLHSP